MCADLSVRAAQQTLGELAQSWREQAAREGRTDIDIIGPTPCLPERVRGRYRWRLLLRGRRIWQFLDGRTVPRNCRIDVDPVRLD